MKMYPIFNFHPRNTPIRHSPHPVPGRRRQGRWWGGVAWWVRGAESFMRILPSFLSTCMDPDPHILDMEWAGQYNCPKGPN